MEAPKASAGTFSKEERPTKRNQTTDSTVGAYKHLRTRSRFYRRCLHAHDDAVKEDTSAWQRAAEWTYRYAMSRLMAERGRRGTAGEVN